jgi:hypothetical protein
MLGLLQHLNSLTETEPAVTEQPSSNSLFVGKTLGEATALQTLMRFGFLLKHGMEQFGVTCICTKTAFDTISARDPEQLYTKTSLQRATSALAQDKDK